MAVIAFLPLLILSVASGIGCSREKAEDKYQRLMSAAEQAKKDSNWDAARINFQSAIDVKPQDATAYFKLAEILVRLGRVQPAVENYNAAINYAPSHREARLHLAAIMLAGKQYELAENHLRRLLEANPDDVEANILMANLEAGGPRKDYAKAQTILEKVLKSAAENTAALASLGHVHLAQGRVKEAEQFLARAAQLEPANAPLQIALADLYARQERTEEAQAVFESLLKKNPEEGGLHFIFGEFLLNRGMVDKAFTEYRDTLNSDPRRHDARDRLYDLFVVRGKTNEAKQLTAELAEKLPEDPGVHYFRGRDSELNGKYDEALNHFLESIKLLNTFAPAFRRAGLNELRLGKETEGVEHLNQAVAIDPGETSARLALAQRLLARRELPQATEHLNQILARQPRHLSANVLRADIALLEGDTERARKVYDYLIKEFPRDPSGYFKLGLLEEKKKNYPEAVKYYRKTLSFDRGVLLPAQRLMIMLAVEEKKKLPDIISEMEKLREQSEASKPEYDLLLGSLNLSAAVAAKDKSLLQKAREFFQRAVDNKPELIGAYFGLAKIDSLSGNLDASVENYEKLLERNPKHVPTLMMLALTRERQDKTQEAADVYRRILAVNPQFGPAANNLAWLLTEELNGDLDEALRLAELAKERLPKEASVTDTLAWVHFKRGSVRVALPIEEEALELEKLAGENRPKNPELLYHLAEIKFAAGDRDGAKEAVEQALQMTPANHPKRAEMEALREKTK